jgi:hypothetical protein
MDRDWDMKVGDGGKWRRSSAALDEGRTTFDRIRMESSGDDPEGEDDEGYLTTVKDDLLSEVW